MLPAIALILFVYVVPFCAGLLVSFTDWRGFGMDMRFIGVRNYAMMARERVVGEVFGNMLVYFLMLVLGQNVVSLLLALLIDAQRKGPRDVFRALFFLPTVTATVAVAYAWSLVLDPLSGPLPTLFKHLSLRGLADTLWLGDPTYAIFSVSLISLWQWTGWNLVVYEAGLRSVPRELYEAADIDGAEGFSRFIHVMIPMLALSFTVNVVLSTIGMLKLFDLPWIMTSGGPGHATESLAITIYSNSFLVNKIGYGSALSFVLFLFVLVVSSIQTLALRRGEENIE